MTRVSIAAAALVCVCAATVGAQAPRTPPRLPATEPQPAAPPPRSPSGPDQLTPDQFGPVDSAELFSDPGQLTPGTNVFLDNVVVRAKSGNLVRVSKGRNFLYVAPVDPSIIESLPIGAVINVRGTLREAPSAAQAKVIYAASPRAARRLARDRVYVDAWDVSLLP